MEKKGYPSQFHSSYSKFSIYCTQEAKPTIVPLILKIFLFIPKVKSNLIRTQLGVTDHTDVYSQKINFNNVLVI